MAYREYAPSPQLRDVVACYWTTSGTEGAHRVLPDGCVDVLFNGVDAPAAIGTMSAAMVADGPAVTHLGARFLPGQALRWLLAPGVELLDQAVALDVLWGSSARALADELGTFDDDTAMQRAVKRLDRALCARRVKPPDARVLHAVGMVEAGHSVDATALAVGVGARQLERLFHTHVGIGPKMLFAVLRLQRAQAAMTSGKRLIHVALDLGYADQAHFTREFRRLAGVTPGQFLRERGVSDLFKTEPPDAGYSAFTTRSGP